MILALFSLVGALLGALVTAAATWRAGRWHDAASRREEWWRRLAWAVDMSMQNQVEQQGIGVAVLGALADSDLAGADEQRIIAAVADQLLAPVLPKDETGAAGPVLYVVRDRRPGGDDDHASQ